MQFAHEAAEALTLHLRDSVLVLDAAVAQTIKWTLRSGWPTVFSGGSVQVVVVDDKETEPKIPQCESSSIVFIFSSHIARHSYTIKSILNSRSYRSCRIVSALSESLHAAELESEAELMSAFDAYLGFETTGYFGHVEKRVMSWMLESSRIHGADPDEDEDIEVFVEYLPLSFAVITPEVFTIPSVHSLFPTIQGGASAYTAAKSLESSNSFDKQTRQASFAIASLLESLQLKEEIFAMGDLSKQIARCIISKSIEAPRRKKTDSNAGLILIDRTLDLTGPMSHSDNLLDIIFRTLKQSTQRDSDREVSPHPLLSDSSYPLTIAHGADPDALDLLRVLTMLPTKDSLVAVRKRLVDLIAKVDPASRPRMLGKLSIEQLQNLLSVFKDNEKVLFKHGAVLGVVAASVEAVIENVASNGNSLLNIEKIITQTLSENMQDPAAAILPVIDVLHKVSAGSQFNGATPPVSPPTSPRSSSQNSSTTNLSQPSERERKALSIEDALKLAVFSYSLMGAAALADVELKGQLGNALMQALSATSNIQGSGSKRNRNEELDRMWVGEVLERLEMIAKARDPFKQKSLVDMNSIVPYRSLVRRVLTSTLLREPVAAGETHSMSAASAGGLASRIDPEDLAHISYGGTLGTVLSGFSRLLGGTRPTLKDYKTLVIFIVGGVTANEVRDIREVAREAGGVQVLIGSTCVADADFALQMLFPRIP
ncbi:Sec1 domain-containing protein 2 [Chytriomyces hyalinus]|nr:Sec1 domain-containing protein 2 [Chytriomyces hyalinus]